MKTCHKWMVFAVIVFVTMVDLGWVFSFGALFMSIGDVFQADRAKTATVQSLLIGVFLGTGLLSGTLLTKIGLPLSMLIACILAPLGFCSSFFASTVYFLYISISIVSAFSLSIVYVCSIVLIERLFEGKQKPVCLSIMHTANAVCTLVYPYFLTWLTEEYGLRGTFLIIGGTSLNTFALFIVCLFNHHETCRDEANATDFTKKSLLGKPTSYSFRSKIHVNKKIPDKAKDISIVFILKNMMTRQFVCLLTGTAVSLTSFNGYLGLILDIAMWKGLNRLDGLKSFLLFNIFAVISRLLPGLLKLKKGVHSFMYPIMSTVSGCIGQVLVYFANGHVMYMTGSSLNGLAYGGVVSSSINAAVKIMPPEQVAMACGFLTTAEGVLSTAAGPIFGKIRDTSGSYGIVLIAVCIVQALATSVFTLGLFFRRKENLNLQNKLVSFETVANRSEDCRIMSMCVASKTSK